ncbi:RimK/LysX family protein [Lentisphaerota bacterium WC36G]|nr:RimK/LysX family protein [Lentisphaerae bacterium WC36]
MLIIGEIENIYLDDFKTPFESRIDSGAATSSIDATKIQSFERDGDKWVKFTITNRKSKKAMILSRRIVRQVRIKGDKMIRYVVKLRIRVGHNYIEREFTLANRKNYRYSMLIGRNVLSGIALIDVSKKKTLD